MRRFLLVLLCFSTLSPYARADLRSLVQDCLWVMALRDHRTHDESMGPRDWEPWVVRRIPGVVRELQQRAATADGRAWLDHALHAPTVWQGTGTMRVHDDIRLLPIRELLVDNSWLTDLARIGELPIRLRVSNASPRHDPEAASPFFGIATELPGLGPQRDRSQHFFVTSKPVTTGADARDNIAFLEAQEAGLWARLGLLVQHPLAVALQVAHRPQGGDVFRETYWSGAVYQMGEELIKYLFTPNESRRSFTLSLQFRDSRHPSHTPIHNGLVAWRTRPYPVATIEMGDESAGPSFRLNPLINYGMRPRDSFGASRGPGYEASQQNRDTR